MVMRLGRKCLQALSRHGPRFMAQRLRKTVEALPLRILAELEHGEPTPELDGVLEAA